MAPERKTEGTGRPEGLTSIHRGIHCAATPEGEDTDETEAIQLSHFFKVLAEVALSVARRKVDQLSPHEEDQA